MKRVVALLGSKRKANTYNLLSQIGDILSRHEIELTVIELYKRDIKDCLGCEVCILKGACVLTDDACDIMRELTRADGIILASPVYLQQVSGKLKTFFDRTCSWYHRPALIAKPILCVATTKGSGLKATLDYMENISAQWGALTAGRVGRTIFNSSKPVSEAEIANFIRLIADPQAYSPRLSQLISFEVQKSLAQYMSGLDAAYWNKSELMNAPYFLSCRINPFKRAISGLIGRVMRKRMSKSAAK